MNVRDLLSCMYAHSLVTWALVCFVQKGGRGEGGERDPLLSGAALMLQWYGFNCYRNFVYC